MKRIASVILALSIAAHAHALSGARKSAEPSAQPAGVVNVNTATVAQLAFLPGVGPKMAAAIIARRPYANVAALDKVKGIGPAKLSRMTSYVTVNGTTTLTAKVKSAKGVKP